MTLVELINSYAQLLKEHGRLTANLFLDAIDIHQETKSSIIQSFDDAGSLNASGSSGFEYLKVAINEKNI